MAHYYTTDFFRMQYPFLKNFIIASETTSEALYTSNSRSA